MKSKSCTHHIVIQMYFNVYKCKNRSSYCGFHISSSQIKFFYYNLYFKNICRSSFYLFVFVMKMVVLMHEHWTHYTSLLEILNSLIYPQIRGIFLNLRRHLCVTRAKWMHIAHIKNYFKILSLNFLTSIPT